MDYHTDQRVRLIKETKHTSLYAWALQELDNQGNPKGRDLIPWLFSLWFKCEKLSFTTQIESEKFLTKKESDPLEVKLHESISGTFNPARLDHSLSFLNETKFSFFGTDRKVKDFYVSIEPIGDSDKEGCFAWGSISYTTEWDFEDKTEPDVITISIFLKRERFEKIKHLVLLNVPIEASLRLSNVDGFYSEWTPQIRTTDVKVLANIKDQKIEVPEELDIKLPTLGHVSDFTLRVWPKSKQEIDKNTVDQRDDEADVKENHQIDDKKLPKDDSARILLIEAGIRSLKKPLWIIILLLIIMLFK